MSRKMRSLTVALVLAALTTTGSVVALPFDAVEFEERGNLLSAVWEWLASILEPGDSAPDDLTSSLDKEGPQLDPDGLD